jgi:CRP/FNR family transcriptional regulator, dissimilatory nitrate respiration regulator
MNKRRIPVTEFLANVSLLRNLDGATIERLAAKTAEYDAPRGTIVFRRGQSGIGMQIVVFGQVKLSLQTGNGDERVISLIDPGMSFGEASIFAAKPYLATAETIADSKLLLVEKDALFAEVRRNPEFSQTVITNLSARLYQHIENLEICTLSSGLRRVIRYLLNHERGVGFDGELRITLPTKKWIIASRLNLTHEHFSRILQALIRDDLIEVDGRRVRIRDTGRLRAYVAE